MVGFGCCSLLLIILPLLSNAQLRILSPQSLVRYYSAITESDGIIPASTSTFGAPAYGETFVGRVVYVNSTSNFCTRDYSEELEIKFGIKPHVASAARLNSFAAAQRPLPDDLNLPSQIEVQKPADAKNGSRLLQSADTDPQKGGGSSAGTNSGGLFGGLKSILLMARGGCSFVQKVAHAQEAGADAVIITDNFNSSWDRSVIQRVILADDGKGNRVFIPSVLITHDDGEPLTAAAGDPRQNVLASLEWSLPQKSIVRLDFWTSSASADGQEFLREWAAVADILRGAVDMNVHYSVFSLANVNEQTQKWQQDQQQQQEQGSEVVAPAAGVINKETIAAMCFDASGEYCSYNADAVNSHIKGSDVISEDLRQICLSRVTVKEISPWTSSTPARTNKKLASTGASPGGDAESFFPLRLSNSSDVGSGADKAAQPENSSGNLMYSTQYWEYMRRFPIECAGEKFGPDCSLALMKSIKGVNTTKVMECIDRDGPNMLAIERGNRAWSVLALRINGARFSGNLDPYLVVRAACSAFRKEEPNSCLEARRIMQVQSAEQAEGSSHGYGGLSIGQSFLVFMAFVVVLGVSLHYYHKRTEAQFRRTLRHEVMMEVKSQMRYQYLGGDASNIQQTTSLLQDAGVKGGYCQVDDNVTTRMNSTGIFSDDPDLAREKQFQRYPREVEMKSYAPGTGDNSTTTHIVISNDENDPLTYKYRKKVSIKPE